MSENMQESFGDIEKCSTFASGY